MSDIIIIGGGLAAATAVTELREGGFEGTITLVAAEDHAPYIRPPLSKGYLQGSDERDSVFVHPQAWYREHDVELRTGARVESVDAAARTITIAGGEQLHYDKLLLATGATPRRLDIPGSDATGIHYLRTLDDSDALRDALKPGSRRVVIVGGGWIGLEIAAAARGYGNDVAVVGRENIPLEGPLGAELGHLFQRLHESHEVRFTLGTTTTGFQVENGAVAGVTTSAGVLPADLVVVGVGAIPSTELAEAAGLQVENGILVDASLRTSDPNIFAAGDVANAMYQVLGVHLRNEHWATAIATGKVAAAALAGKAAVLDEIPYFYTDQFEIGMEYSGYAPLAKNARVVYRGDPASLEFIAFWVLGQRVVAGMNVNVWDVNEAVQELIRSARDVDVLRLADPAIDLAEV
ncbi:MAG: FAD-dependent oxidoreductase [Rhodoglobus sp.]